VALHRNPERKLRVLFAGNTAPRYYDNRGLKQYDQLTRNEGIKTVLELGPKVKFTQDVRGFCDFLERTSYANECRIVGTDHTFPISATEWLKFIAKCDFFICFSGTDLPMCHNAIEAMAVGAIPIIGYADWFFPPLEHRKNAILYAGKEDLKAKVEEVLQMGSAEIEAMRRNVIEYYERNLTIASFIRKYENSGNKINTIMLHPRLICTASEDEQGKRLLDELKCR
jgi:glycosyltransferase involved in cell wall biosynthesis